MSRKLKSLIAEREANMLRWLIGIISLAALSPAATLARAPI